MNIDIESGHKHKDHKQSKRMSKDKDDFFQDLSSQATDEYSVSEKGSPFKKKKKHKRHREFEQELPLVDDLGTGITSESEAKRKKGIKHKRENENVNLVDAKQSQVTDAIPRKGNKMKIFDAEKDTIDFLFTPPELIDPGTNILLPGRAAEPVKKKKKRKHVNRKAVSDEIHKGTSAITDFFAHDDEHNIVEGQPDLPLIEEPVIHPKKKKNKVNFQELREDELLKRFEVAQEESDVPKKKKRHKKDSSVHKTDEDSGQICPDNDGEKTAVTVSEQMCNNVEHAEVESGKRHKKSKKRKHFPNEQNDLLQTEIDNSSLVDHGDDQQKMEDLVPEISEGQRNKKRKKKKKDSSEMPIIKNSEDFLFHPEDGLSPISRKDERISNEKKNLEEVSGYDCINEPDNIDNVKQLHETELSRKTSVFNELENQNSKLGETCQKAAAKQTSRSKKKTNKAKDVTRASNADLPSDVKLCEEQLVNVMASENESQNAFSVHTNTPQVVDDFLTQRSQGKIKKRKKKSKDSNKALKTSVIKDSDDFLSHSHEEDVEMGNLDTINKIEKKGKSVQKKILQSDINESNNINDVNSLHKISFFKGDSDNKLEGQGLKKGEDDSINDSKLVRHKTAKQRSRSKKKTNTKNAPIVRDVDVKIGKEQVLGGLSGSENEFHEDSFVQEVLQYELDNMLAQEPQGKTKKLKKKKRDFDKVLYASVVKDCDDILFNPHKDISASKIGNSDMISKIGKKRRLVENENLLSEYDDINESSIHQAMQQEQEYLRSVSKTKKHKKKSKDSSKVSKTSTIKDVDKDYFLASPHESDGSVGKVGDLDSINKIPKKRSPNTKGKKKNLIPDSACINNSDDIADTDACDKKMELKEPDNQNNSNIVQSKAAKQTSRSKKKTNKNSGKVSNSAATSVAKVGEEHKISITSASEINLLLKKIDLVELPIDFDVPLHHQKEKLIPLTKREKEECAKEGIIIKDGGWTEEEKNTIIENWKRICPLLEIQDPAILLGWGSKPKKLMEYVKVKHLYAQLARGLNDRALASVYRQARNIFRPNNSDNPTQKGVKKHPGEKWTVLSELLHVTPTKCSTPMVKQKSVITDEWTKEEEKRFTQAVNGIGAQNIESQSLDSKSAHWTMISKIVVSRNPYQCQKHWRQRTSKSREKSKWTKTATACLIYFLYRNLAAETVIDWSSIHEHFKHYLSSDTALRERWDSIKSEITELEGKSHAESVTYMFCNYLPHLMKEQNLTVDKLFEMTIGC